MTKKAPKPIVFSTDPNDPPFWPLNMTPEEKLRRLKMLSPQAAKGIMKIVDDTLRRAWPQQPRTRKGGGR